MENRLIQGERELQKLLDGNKNFVNGCPTADNMCLNTLRKYAFHQEPYAAVLSCSDSRVVPEIIFDCGIGELFVIRV
ncbi:MAG: carbonic anhydrase, partial [bacterium]|nr:carbonic anhydrase [bacterium]